MTSATEQKLLFPGLAGFYAWWRDIAYTLVRIVIGYILLMHGWVKVNTGITGVAGFMAKNGLEPSQLFAGAAMFLETDDALLQVSAAIADHAVGPGVPTTGQDARHQGLGRGSHADDGVVMDAGGAGPPADRPVSPAS